MQTNVNFDVRLLETSPSTTQRFRSTRAWTFIEFELIYFRLLAAPVMLDGSESSGSAMKGTLTLASLQLLECLVEKETQSQPAVAEYIEVGARALSKLDYWGGGGGG